MAQLDRFLNLLVTNNGTALVMSEGEIATVTIKDLARPVMKQPLTSAQILTLVREIAPANEPHSLDAAGGVRFEYSCADGTFEVSLTQNGKIAARIQPKIVAQSSPKPKTPNEQAAAPKVATQPAAAPTAARQPAPRVEAPRTETPIATAVGVSNTGNRTLDKIENLLRTLVANRASDLHLRAGSPPMLRANGEIAAIPNESVVTSGEIDAMLQALPSQDRSDAAFDQEWGDEVRRALAEVPEYNREIFLLHYVEGFSYDEIERITGVRQSALKMRVKRASDHLRARLAKVYRG